MIKAKVDFWMAGFFPANRCFLKTFQIALIGWIKAGPPKKPLLFRSCKQAINICKLIHVKLYFFKMEFNKP